jgi:3-oxoacyl-[acyl-carrier protein] reductase
MAPGKARTALVGGASGGLGLAIAEALVRQGRRVAITSRSSERIHATAERIGARGYVHEAADVDAVGPLLAAIEADLGPVEILVTNSGGPPGGPDPLGFTPEQWQAAYETLILGPMALISAVVPGMRQRGFGRIVGVSSSAVREPIANLMLSNVHRAGLLAGFKTLSRQLAGDGITVNSVLPGPIATDRILALTDGGSAENLSKLYGTVVPSGHPGAPAELADPVAFLCSEEASYVSGEALRVDGALTLSV